MGVKLQKNESFLQEFSCLVRGNRNKLASLSRLIILLTFV
jgi:hypothetical protein